MKQTFNEPQRRQFLQAYFRDLARWRELDFQTVTGKATHEAEEEMIRLEGRLRRCRDIYEAMVPALPLSRCPFRGEITRHSIDSLGLDGLWWNCDAPVRPVEDLPTSFLGLAGAVKFGGPIEKAPFLCKPGPEVPWLLPKLLNHPEVHAVISPLRIGAHRGFAIFYYADPLPQQFEGVNTWGINYYRTPRGGWNEMEEDEREIDYDLAPWIESGKASWIAWEDETLEIRQGISGCPYLNLPGRRQWIRIYNGNVVEPSLEIDQWTQ